MGWGTFIASRMIRGIKLRDSGLDNEKFKRDLARREEDENRLRREFVRFALEETVLAHPKIRATIVIDEWIDLSVRISERAINLTTSTIYVAISTVLGGLSVIPWLSSARTGDTSDALRITFYFFLVTGYSYILIERVYVKRCFAAWINKSFQAKGWNTKELMKEVRLASDTIHSDLESLKGIRKLGLPFLLLIRGSRDVKETVRERSKLKKARRNNLFPSNPNID